VYYILHVLSFRTRRSSDLDLISAVQRKKSPGVSWTAPTKHSSFREVVPPAGEYLSVWRPSDGIGIAGTLRQPESQWIRRVIAEEDRKSTRLNSSHVKIYYS